MWVDLDKFMLTKEICCCFCMKHRLSLWRIYILYNHFAFLLTFSLFVEAGLWESRLSSHLVSYLSDVASSTSGFLTNSCCTNDVKTSSWRYFDVFCTYLDVMISHATDPKADTLLMLCIYVICTTRPQFATRHMTVKFHHAATRNSPTILQQLHRIPS